MNNSEKIVEYWRQRLGNDFEIPAISTILRVAKPAVQNKDESLVEFYKKLIYLLHNFVVSPYSVIGENVYFAYGGIGLVIHEKAIIGDFCSIGPNVLIGGKPRKSTDLSAVPVVEEHVYIISKFSVIGANAVVVTDVPPFSMVAGIPAKVIKKIDKTNCLFYRTGYFRNLSHLADSEYVALFPDKILECL